MGKTQTEEIKTLMERVKWLEERLNKYPITHGCMTIGEVCNELGQTIRTVRKRYMSGQLKCAYPVVEKFLKKDVIAYLAQNPSLRKNTSKL